MTSSGSASTKAGGAGASDSLTFPTRQLRGDPSKGHHRETEAAVGSRVGMPMGEDGAPSVDKTWFLAVPPGACLGTHHSHLHPGGHFPSPVCLPHSKEAETSCRKQCLP